MNLDEFTYENDIYNFIIEFINLKTVHKLAL